MVDELRVWPHACHRCFKAGSAHLTADTVEELHAFALRIGLKRSWFQKHSVPHYDLSPSRREAALRHGAIFVSAREQALRRSRRARGEPILRRRTPGGNAPRHVDVFPSDVAAAMGADPTMPQCDITYQEDDD